MKKLTILLISLISLTSFAQDKIVRDETGKPKILEAPVVKYEIPDTLFRGEGVTDRDIEVFYEAAHDTTYVEYLSSKIFADSWYLSTKTIETTSALSVEDGVLHAKKETKEKEESHEVITIVFMIIFLTLVVSIAARLTKIKVFTGDFEKHLFAYSKWIFMIGIPLFILGLVIQSFDLGVALFIIWLCIMSIMKSTDVINDEVGLVFGFAIALIVGYLAQLINPEPIVIFASITIAEFGYSLVIFSYMRD